jgi:hypothetical protein
VNFAAQPSEPVFGEAIANIATFVKSWERRNVFALRQASARAVENRWREGLPDVMGISRRLASDASFPRSFRTNHEVTSAARSI